MTKIISVIPNICEGKDKQFIDDLVNKLANIKGLIMLDVSMDKTRNRTTFAFTGSKKAIFDGGFIMYDEALKHIDMRNHSGEYPRIGALDVFPFVPLKDVTIEDTIEMSAEFAKKVAEKFNVPVYLYGESAKFPMRKDIDAIREGEYEGLENKLKDPRWKPDFGSDAFRPDFGATIIGSRFPIVTFKIYFNSSDLNIINQIGQSFEYSKGGLRFVTAYPGLVRESNLTEITVKITNYTVTPMYKVLELARLEARRFGLSIINVEMIGLIPERVFLDSALFYMNINQFTYDRIAEKAISTATSHQVNTIL